LAAIAFSVLRTIYRFADFMGKRLEKMGNNKDNESAVFTENNFLDSDGRFNASLQQ